MPLKLNDYKDIFNNIKKGQAFLFIGQDYLKQSSKYYNALLKELEIKGYEPTLNELWCEYDKNENLSELKKAMEKFAKNTNCLPWLRIIMAMGWNGVFASAVNAEWISASTGSDSNINLMSRDELEELLPKSNFRKIFSKKNMPLIPLFGDEAGLPQDRSALRRMKSLQTVFTDHCESILCQYGYLIIDGLERDDWFNVTKFQDIFVKAPNDCIYIFGMTEKKLESMCSDDDWYGMRDFLDSGRLHLCEKSLKEIVEELGLTETVEIDDEDHYGDVRVSVGSNGDTMWIERSDCIRMQNMGITLLRDELMNSLILRRRDTREEFAYFLMQSPSKDWRYFSVKDEKISSFHIKRKIEGDLCRSVSDQLYRPSSRRSIVLLKGNSNTGKSTTLNWLAREIYEKLPLSLSKNSVNGKKKASDRYAVLYINDDPAMYNSKWMEDLTDFIKDKLYDRTTVNDQRINNVIIIWDNENSRNKWSDYERLNTILNECNVVIIGSIYEFESRKLKQGNRPIEIPISAVLDDEEKIALNSLLKNVDNNMYENLYNMSRRERCVYLFEALTHFAEYNYSPVWQAYKQKLASRLNTEANKAESVTNQELDLFLKTRSAVLKDGIGAGLMMLKIDPSDTEKTEKKESLRNAITDLNLILAVAGQFKKMIALPESLIFKTVLDNLASPFEREIDRIRKILSLDSMAKYIGSDETGIRYVSFRHSSEAMAYLDNTIEQDNPEAATSERKAKEIDVLIRLIKNCDWNSTTGIHEAKAVTALIRCFGANSYGKFGENTEYRGNFFVYAAYWEDIIEALDNSASRNPDAILIVGHFTRELIQLRHKTGMEFEENDLKSLEDVFDNMEYIVDDDHVSPSKSAKVRLYGEMCRNLLQRIIISSEKGTDPDELSEQFISIFRNAVKLTKKCNMDNHSVGTILLLDIWLNFVTLKNLDSYLPDTLEYIESLLYDEGDLIDDNDDLVNVITNINEVYEKIGEQGEEGIEKLRALFEGKNNDSWAYFRGKMELVKIYTKFKNKICKFGSDNDSLPTRIFFLNEWAADDFNNDDDNKLFKDIKVELKNVSKEIISILEDNYSNDVNRMSFRCLRLYLQAKWMYYTGNLLLEYDQRPGLTEEQWKELYAISIAAYSKCSENESPTRAMVFISSIYRFVFLGEPWDSRRGTEQPNKRICLCTPAEDDGTIHPRFFCVSTNIINEKVRAKISKEITNGDHIKTLARIYNERCSIYVPATVLKKHPDMKRKAITNISHKFEIWFNLGGPQLRDADDEEV